VNDKNQIKIDGLRVEEMRLNHIPDVLRLASKAQSKLKVFAIGAPSVIFKQVSLVLQQNFRNSFVFLLNEKIIGAFVLKRETTISAEIVYCFFCPDFDSYEKAAETIKNHLISSKFSVLSTKINKARKDYVLLIEFMNALKLTEILVENDCFQTISTKKP
jgi:hypothetical protein